ncbi:glutathione S-transferase family protein [Aestuariivirga sp. YIM B02566]|uniref:Glutathione S-transferase family protein n=1 Tax=Taklimakanibacter albus TaxID=2800327 RepID=A0ACC5RA59_9HYPH|nr:glutathione S-transferase [Aestuariivirga sp. YIM B02566]MBK1869548.1 glutathione S-transferase family protein [Aestuariivirga sp. YIM B02566]
MSEYTLHCFGESGNAYKAALMLELSRCDWSPVWVDYFNGETRQAEFRAGTNEMGEVPILGHKRLKLTQSGVILDYLAEQTRKFGPKSEDERREVWRWILFDNHKFTSYLATLRFMINFTKTGETPVTEFLRPRVISALKIVDQHLAGQPFIIGKRATIADFSLCGYLFYGEEIPVPLQEHIHVMKWLDRIRALPGWKPPYELMPRGI